ncbi:MAG TPA: DUF4262 domain-containing protein [Acidimicrobiales bacterium]|nr:DUF4262 domain-containing protein [Acidimicrobiales bacterium]
MCAICDGMTEDQLQGDLQRRIARYGYTTLSVDGPEEWTYTIGLTASFDHPEFVVTGLPARPASMVIQALADRVRNGERFSSADSERLVDEFPVRFGDVHPSQWQHGRFDGWKRYYAWLGRTPALREALQIVWSNDEWIYPPDERFGLECNNACQPLLDSPATGNVNRRRRW